jgi:hypothetical protein
MTAIALPVPPLAASLLIAFMPRIILGDHRLSHKLNVMVKLYEKYLHKGYLVNATDIL